MPTGYRRTIVAFLGVVFMLQWTWETAHGVAYVETDMVLMDRLWHCLPMAVVDSAWSAGIVLAAAIAAGWLGRPWLTWALAVAAGAVTATQVEHAALKSGRWTYNALMPIAPIVGVGLWPVLQMSLLPPLALLIARKSSRSTQATPVLMCPQSEAGEVKEKND